MDAAPFDREFPFPVPVYAHCQRERLFLVVVVETARLLALVPVFHFITELELSVLFQFQHDVLELVQAFFPAKRNRFALIFAQMDFGNIANRTAS